MTRAAADTLWCAPDIHMVAIERDIVVLDVHGDRYHCLPGLSDRIAISGDGRLHCRDEALRQELVAAGLASDQPLGSTRQPIQIARREVTPTSTPSRANVARAAVSMVASTTAFRGRSLANLVVRDASLPTNVADDQLLAELTGAARRARPWIPFEGECLHRSFQLRRLLAHWNLPVDWIFGVRTWPFGAHCWLQSGDIVIGDRLSRVQRYTPIMRA